MLTVKMEGNDLVIRIDAATLASSTEVAFERAFADGAAVGIPFKIVDPMAFARAVVEQLEREEEDGTTPVHEMLDAAMVAAVENGCEGVEEVELSKDSETNE